MIGATRSSATARDSLSAESFVQPIIVLVAVALSFTGALLTLALVGSTVNLFSQIASCSSSDS